MGTCMPWYDSTWRKRRVRTWVEALLSSMAFLCGGCDSRSENEHSEMTTWRLLKRHLG